jgi:hypothetical protein
LPDLDSCIAQALVGRRHPASVDEARQWLAHAESHRVHVLLADRWIRSADPHGAAGGLRRTLVDVLRAAFVEDAIREAECRRVYAMLGRAGIRAAVFKGAALAHTVYEATHLRPRCDTDLLIDIADTDAVARTLLELGYIADVETSGDLVSAQSHFSRVDAHCARHAWDVHWRASNTHTAANLLSLDRIASTARRPPALEGLFAPSRADALLLACVHRIAHHHDAPDLIWLYDIHLLAESFSARDGDEWSAFVAYASECNALEWTIRSLARAQQRFGTSLPASVQQSVDAAEIPPPDVAGSWREVDVLRMNLRALPGWSDRLRLVRQHLFPPAAFVVEKYGLRHRAALPLAYLHRIVTGAPKWFRRQGAA